MLRGGSRTGASDKASPIRVTGKRLEGKNKELRDAIEDGVAAGALGSRTKKAAADYQKQQENRDANEGRKVNLDGCGPVAADGRTHRGDSEEPVPMFWFKPPDAYEQNLGRLAGGRSQLIHAFPHRWYPPEPPDTASVPAVTHYSN